MEPVGRVADVAVGRLLAAVPLSPEKVRFAWRVAVGPAIDRATSVSLHRGRLSVRADDEAWAREVDRAAALILERMGRLLGRGTVRALDVEPAAAGRR